MNLRQYSTNEYQTGPSRVNPVQEQLPMVRPSHSVSDPRQMKRRNPLEVNVNKKREFEAVDPFSSNNPYSKFRK